MWNKRGVFYSSQKAQLPVVQQRKDCWRIYFTSRNNNNQNVGNYIDVDIGEPFVILDEQLEVLVPGSPGDCDAAGVMPTAIFEDKLYYIGWTLRQDVPYYNYTCLFYDGVKRGPILSPDTVDQGYSGTFCVIKPGDIQLGYYLSCIGWLPDENDQLQPSYDIKIAESIEGIRWYKRGKTAIELEDEEAGISSATVIEYNNIFHMWFSTRQAVNFRSDPQKAYKIKHATSTDGFNWTRDDKFGIVPELDFEKIMCAYPNVIIHEDRLHMFYNGDGFGETGIAHATMELSCL